MKHIWVFISIILLIGIMCMFRFENFENEKVVETKAKTDDPPDTCSTINNKNECVKENICSWFQTQDGGSCIKMECNTIDTEDSCNNIEKCSWNKNLNKCFIFDYSYCTISPECTQNSNCIWNETKQKCDKINCETIYTEELCKTYGKCSWNNKCLLFDDKFCNNYTRQDECKRNNRCDWNSDINKCE